LHWWNGDLAWLKGSVESVVSKGGPRPSAALTRGRYTLPHNIINPFQPQVVGGDDKDMAWSKGIVESVVGVGGPRPSVASTRLRYACPITGRHVVRCHRTTKATTSNVARARDVLSSFRRPYLLEELFQLCLSDKQVLRGLTFCCSKAVFLENILFLFASLFESPARKP